jgi:dTDP-4-amino-4,6-dideoxygalactose transaminase
MNGQYTEDFEFWLAQKNRSVYAITCHSGTQALEIIARYLYEHEHAMRPPTVVIPALTYVATANAWKKAGWNIHIVDTDNHGLLDAKKIPRDLSWQAICPVGLYGAGIAESLAVPRTRWRTGCVEDGAQHWLSDNCKRIGFATSISFDPTKNFGNYGNGGAVVTNDHALADFARDWTRNGQLGQCEVGTNSRMSEVDCAQLLVKSAYIDAWQDRRQKIAAYWMQKLAGSSVRCLIDQTNFDQHCFHKFVIEVTDRDQVQKQLQQFNIETKVHYRDPIQDLPQYQQYQGPNMLSASHALSRRCLSLPIYPELTDSEVEYIASSLLDCV